MIYTSLIFYACPLIKRQRHMLSLWNGMKLFSHGGALLDLEPFSTSISFFICTRGS